MIGRASDEEFIETIYREHVDNTKLEISEFNRMERRVIPASLESFFPNDTDRAIAIRSAYKTGGYTMKEIAEFCGVHYSTISRVLKSQ